jgi:ATP-dependent phosphofructokinase / diphosphate-dependent phosphofructokinase
MRIGVLTGGGDVPGLNAAIRAVSRRSFEYGWEVVGIKNGWSGLLEQNADILTRASVSGILHVGGTILGSSRTNPSKMPNGIQRSLDGMKGLNLDAIVAIGGDDTLSVALRLFEAGAKTVGVPKTMDNDVAETDYCIGFDTAVSTVADALDKLHTTASAHHRVLVVEVMGRDAGWVATFGGLAGGADYIFAPEEPSSISDVCKHLERRRGLGKTFSIIVVAEGAKIEEVQEAGTEESNKDSFGHVRLDLRGLGETVAREIERRTGFETRSVVLGHVQRGGPPTVFDRVLATRLGVFAADLVKDGRFGLMAALQGNQIVAVPLKDALAYNRTVPKELLQLAKIFF